MKYHVEPFIKPKKENFDDFTISELENFEAFRNSRLNSPAGREVQSFLFNKDKQEKGEL